MNIPVTCEFDIVIAGGGAAGLAAAVKAGLVAKSVGPASGLNQALRMALIEKKEVPGKKLSATGNGRCKLSNTACTDRKDVDGFFDCLGLLIRTDEAGRMYPDSEEAGEVSSLLEETARQQGTEFYLNTKITKIEAQEEGFWLTAEKEGKPLAICCRKLLLALGGKSYSVFGTTGDGYGIARRLGHSVTRLAPSLVPVCVDASLGSLAGVRTKAKVGLLHCGQLIAEEEGEVQFNKDCISGICVMNLSRHLVLNSAKPFADAFAEYELCIDLVPEYSSQELVDFLCRKPAGQMLQGLVRKKLAAYILGRTEEPRQVASLLKDLRFTVSGTRGWNDAQVTRGGVVLDEVNPKTMESRLVPGLYFAGEILDYDGPCGGWNLHFAWNSGLRAGRAMVQSLCRAEET
ncbi:MAG: aminoacetone oxidase family FAD-binding enzyme [Firmicutes bacterium]|nr:aminoacetone oxidase family FAD-binding enzyme [Bacillota bacterium]